MSSVQLLMAAEAAAQNRAVRRTAYRHRHISSRPFVVAAYNLSGEAAAPFGFCYGQEPDHPKLSFAPEPRNRDARFKAIHDFAIDVVRYVTPFLKLVPEPQRNGKPRNGASREIATDAPQIVFPNQATRDYLGTRLGRSLRYLGLGQTQDVSTETKWAAAHLSWFGDHARMPGQSAFIAATELLARHFVTGQSQLENENLASLLAWIENAPTAGRKLIEAAESAAYGPVPSPDWERGLEREVIEWSRTTAAGQPALSEAYAEVIRKQLFEALAPAYRDTHRALALMRDIPAARSIDQRWKRDISAWSSHAHRAKNSIPRFSKRHDAIRAAQMLGIWSSALEQLKFEESLDDPLVLSELDAQGSCIIGTVRRVTLDNHEIKPGNKRRSQVPLVTIALRGATRLLSQDSLVWAQDPKVKAEVRSISKEEAVLALTDGHNRGTRVPVLRDEVSFAALGVFGGLPPQSPLNLPWTHRGIEDNTGSRRRPSIAEGLEDSSADMEPTELASMPIAGATPLEDVPGVVL